MSDNQSLGETKGVVKTLSGEAFSQKAQAPGDGARHASPVAYKPFSGWAPCGVPRNELDIEYAVEQLHEVYFAQSDDKLTAMDRLITQNERIVSRSGMLMSFSGIIVGILLFIANNAQIFSNEWQRIGFYGAVVPWVVCTIRLLWALRHKLPPPWEYNTSVDFKMTARLYLLRMNLYNDLLIASVFCFVVMMALLMPLSATFVDFIFRSKG